MRGEIPFTIVIPTKDRCDTLRYSLMSAISQSYQNYQVIVSDNASSDNTKSVVESFDDERDPLQAQLFENPHKMSNGWIHLNEKPGLGLEISEAALKKFGKLVYKNK